MHVASVQRALCLMVDLINAAAVRVFEDADSPTDLIGYTARSSLVAARPATLEEQITTLVDKLQIDLQNRFTGPSNVYWKTKPEIIYGTNYVKIQCRVRISPTIDTRKATMPQPQAIQ